MSPFELIAAINNSHVTVSNSFHGVALSLLTATNFLAVELPGSRNTLSSRVKDLLEELNLLDRLIPADDLPALVNFSFKPIPWDEVNVKISNMRSKGIDFLDANI